MFDRFLRQVESAPGATAVIETDGGRVVTREALLARAEELARELQARGLRARDLIAVQLPNSADFVAAVLAAAKLDLVLVPIDRDALPPEVMTVLGHFAVRSLIYRNGGTSISTRVVDGPPSIPAEARLIKLTSGSTGLPKGIVTSERNLMADCTSICASMDIRADDINFGAIPMSHSYGFSNLVMPLLMQGTQIVISNQYLPQSVIDLCNRYACTVVPLIPMVFEHLSALPDDFETARAFRQADSLVLWMQRVRRHHVRLSRRSGGARLRRCGDEERVAVDRVGAAGRAERLRRARVSARCQLVSSIRAADVRHR